MFRRVSLPGRINPQHCHGGRSRLGGEDTSSTLALLLDMGRGHYAAWLEGIRSRGPNNVEGARTRGQEKGAEDWFVESLRDG